MANEDFQTRIQALSDVDGGNGVGHVARGFQLLSEKKLLPAREQLIIGRCLLPSASY